VTRREIVERLRASLPGWTIREVEPPRGWTSLDGEPIRDPWSLRIQPPGFGERDAAYLLVPRTRKYGRTMSFGSSWVSDPWPGGRGWPERFAAYLAACWGAS